MLSSAPIRNHRRVKVGKTHVGQGVFAIRPFLEEEVVGEIRGRVIDDPDYDSQYSIDLGENRSLEPNSPFRFLNHCCEPNCEIVYWDGPGGFIEDRKLYLQTLREIRRGEELTIDYGWPADAAIPCLCGHRNCRGWIVAQEELPDLLTRLRSTQTGGEFRGSS